MPDETVGTEADPPKRLGERHFFSGGGTTSLPSAHSFTASDASQDLLVSGTSLTQDSSREGVSAQPASTMNNLLLAEDAEAVRRRFDGASPLCALILGSGWNEVAEAFPVHRAIPYAEIPCLGGTAVAGHVGRLLLADTGPFALLVFQGRRHWYEGAGWDPVAAPVRISLAMGARVLVLTNAAGGISPYLSAGDLMVIDDHINAIGGNPLIGPHDPAWGPQFPDQTAIYDARLREGLHEAGRRTGLQLRRGTYLATAGPTYETAAEVAAFRALGAHAVGMSTVPEAILANAAGMKVAGLSCITNLAAGMAPSPLSHDDVLSTTRHAQPRMRALLAAFLKDLPSLLGEP